ncbi:major facilitator superfamily domain-containing protein 4A [Protopterus annectens]|uniref:major facilitator superfamily domain-containing protein 4A n=1 Tax=Protopterus annectens TaxID=7888 RepID=UPI001CFA47FB|nr:major facilitator superfamily domain-containing protein 4A [Protopterus annectens]
MCPTSTVAMWDERVSNLFRRNLQSTLTYWSVFFSFGLCIAFLGPTVLDLRCQTHSSLSQIAWVFFSQQFCLLAGSCLGGFFNKTTRCSLITLFTSTLLISVVFSIIPVCYEVVLLALVMAVAGLAMGCIDTTSNVQLVQIYQKDSAVFLQALHFFVGFGALLSPLIVDPFLSETNCIQSNATANATRNLKHIRKTIIPHQVHNTSAFHLEKEGVAITQVSYAFWIMALINLPVPIAVFYLMYKKGVVACCRRKSTPLLPADQLASEVQMTEIPSDPEKAEAEAGGHGAFDCFSSPKLEDASFPYFAVHITAAMVLFMSDGIIGAYSAFVYTYAVEQPLSIAHKEAGYLPSLFWAFIMIGRLVSIPVSFRLRPSIMVFINMTGVILTFLLLLIFVYSEVFLFIGTAFLGLSLSSIFPSILAYTEDILNYKGCGTTVLVTGAGLGEMTLQILVGSIIQSQGSYSFLVCGTIFGCMSFWFYILLVCSHRMYIRDASEIQQKDTTHGDSGIPYQ